MTPRLFLHVWSLEARAAMSYRADFWLKLVFGFLASFAMVYFLWAAVFRESGLAAIGGYDFPSMVVYFLAVILLGQLVRGADFSLAIAEDIYQGGLNRYFVFPVGYLPFKYAQHLGSLVPAVLRLLLFGALLVPFLGRADSISITPVSVFLTLVAVALGNLLHFLLSLPIQAVAYWADNVWSLEVAKRFLGTLLGGFMIPLTVFPGWARAVLELLPFRFIYDFPARILLGALRPGEIAVGMAVALVWCAVFFAIGRMVWRRGVLQYSGVGI